MIPYIVHDQKQPLTAQYVGEVPVPVAQSLLQLASNAVGRRSLTSPEHDDPVRELGPHPHIVSDLTSQNRLSRPSRAPQYNQASTCFPRPGADDPADGVIEQADAAHHPWRRKPRIEPERPGRAHQQAIRGDDVTDRYGIQHIRRLPPLTQGH